MEKEASVISEPSEKEEAVNKEETLKKEQAVNKEEALDTHQDQMARISQETDEPAVVRPENLVEQEQ